VIRADEVMALLLVAVPSFEPIWYDMQADHIHAGPNQIRLHHLDAATFVGHLVDQHRHGRTEAVQRAFEVIERMAIEGNGYVQNLANVGYLERIRNCARADDALSDDDFVGYLGPVSLLAWIELQALRGTTDA
jgi:hypothetical protein